VIACRKERELIAPISIKPTFNIIPNEVIKDLHKHDVSNGSCSSSSSFNFSWGVPGDQASLVER